MRSGYRWRVSSDVVGAGATAGVADRRHRTHLGRRLLVGSELVELALEVVLEPSPVLTLVGSEVLDLALQLVPLTLDGGHGRLATLVGLVVELLRTDARVRLKPVGLAAGLVGDPLRLAAGLTDYAVGLFLGLIHELVCVGRRDLQQPRGGGGRVTNGRRRPSRSDRSRNRR